MCPDTKTLLAFEEKFQMCCCVMKQEHLTLTISDADLQVQLQLKTPAFVCQDLRTKDAAFELCVSDKAPCRLDLFHL